MTVNVPGIGEVVVADVPHVMRWLAEDPQRVAVFFNSLGAGMWDEWDCGLDSAFEIFGEVEFAVALKTGAIVADDVDWTDNEGS